MPKLLQAKFDVFQRLHKSYKKITRSCNHSVYARKNAGSKQPVFPITKFMLKNRRCYMVHFLYQVAPSRRKVITRVGILILATPR